MASTNDDLLRTQGAEPAMRMLMACCNEKSLVTYKQIAAFISQEISWNNEEIWRHMGDVVGDLMDRIWQEIDTSIPPVNLLVVNGQSRLPSSGSDGHLDRYLGETGSLNSLSNTERDTLLDRMFRDVWAYEEWHNVYEKLFGPFDPSTLPDSPSNAEFEEKDGKDRRGGYGGPAEGPEHKALKQAVLDNPERIIGKSSLIFSKPEMSLKSGDEVDAYFSCEDKIICVEVKSEISSDKDIERGIFQCIKYQAVSQAEEVYFMPSDKERPVRSILVIGRRSLGNKLRHLAKSLNVEIQLWGKREK